MSTYTFFPYTTLFRSRTTVEMAKAGFLVIATMRDLARRTHLDEALPAELKNKVDVRRLDVTEFDTIPGVVSAMVRDHGRIDVDRKSTRLNSSHRCISY